ncbi:MAG: MFS transporter [Erysipelotrichaceae bacterium]|nr:MFS transporter [Erysipelotrichaceae bacterium]
MKIDKKYIFTYIVCCLFILAIGLGNASGVFVVPMADKLGVGRGTITLASTLTDLICCILSPVLVYLLKRFELRKILFIATLTYTLSLIGVAMCNNVILYFILYIIKGFAFIVFSVHVVIIALGNWFEKGRETLVGIAVGFTSIGGAIFSQVFTWLMNNYSLEFTFIFYGIATFVLALPAILYLKLRPEERGLSILKGDSIKKEKEKIESKRMFHFTDPVFIGICAIFFIMTLLTNISIHFPGYADSIDMAHMGASMVSAMMMGGFIFKVGIGYICDQYGVKIAYPLSIVTVLVSIIVIVLGKSEISLLTGSFLFGGIFGNVISLNPFIRYCFGDDQHDEVYAKVLVVSAVSNFGAPVVGYLYDFTGTYITSFYAGMILCVIALVIYFMTMKTVDKV